MIIVKIGGGKEIRDNLSNILKDFAGLEEKKLIVHGANHEMSIVCGKMGVAEQIVKSPSGFSSRYTDRATLEVFEMVYSGVANKRIVEMLQKNGVNAIGLSGVDGRLLVGNRKPHVKIVEKGKVKLLRDNFTGTVEEINSGLLNLLMDAGYVPVLAPPAISFEGDAINVDNDRIVGALCKGLGAHTVISLFEAPGLLKDVKDPASVIPKIARARIDEFMQFAQGRMMKKVHHAKDAFENGAKRVIFADGRREQPITDALAGMGTTFE